MFSYYYLPSTVLGNEKHDKLIAVCPLYEAATTMNFLELVSDSLIIAKKEGVDLYNTLDVRQFDEVFEPLKFGQGNGFLHYYFYNWKCPFMEAKQVGMVLI